MKKYLIFLLVLAANLAIAQRTTITEKLIVKQSFELNGRTVTEISNDPLLGDSSVTAVPTEAAVKAYVDAFGGGGGTSIDTFYLNATKDTLWIIAPPDTFFAVLDFPTNTEFQDSLTDLRADLAAIAAAKLDTTLADSQIFVGNSNNKATPRTLSGDATLSNAGVLTLANSGVSAGSYGSATQVPVLIFDAKGRATAVTNTSITGLLSGLTTNRIPVATSGTALGNGYFLQDANGVTLDLQRYFKQTGGTTLQRPAGSAGMEWYNTDQNEKQIYTTAWQDVLTGNFTSGLIAYGTTNGQLTQDTIFQWDNALSRLLIRRSSTSGTVQAFVIGRVNNSGAGMAGNPFAINYLGGDQYSITANALTIDVASSSIIFKDPIRLAENNSIRTNNNRVALRVSEINANATRIPMLDFAETATSGYAPFKIGFASRSQPSGVYPNATGLNVVGTIIKQTITADTANATLTALEVRPTYDENSQTGIITRGIRYNPTTPSATHYALTISSGNVGIGTETPGQALHVSGNTRITGAYYDSTNDPGTSGQYLQSTATGTDWKSEYVGFNYYDADPDTLSPVQGQIFELDATSTVSGWTQQLKSVNMCSGCAITVIIKTLTGGKDITIDSPSGDFLVDTTDTSAATGSLGFSGSATVRRRVIWTGTHWLFISL